MLVATYGYVVFYIGQWNTKCVKFLTEIKIQHIYEGNPHGETYIMNRMPEAVKWDFRFVLRHFSVFYIDRKGSKWYIL